MWLRFTLDYGNTFEIDTLENVGHAARVPRWRY